ncbi:hypothetical protein ABZ743_32985, partial [Streptomyces sp. NPDC006662]|uniref:hypothetical protein n=1 Tax=Streptomyces sp. NPDC006662 TaxID=3156902 RepID=UPI0033C03DA0
MEVDSNGCLELDKFGSDGLTSSPPPRIQGIEFRWGTSSSEPESEAGKSGGKLLIESEPPERESAKAKDLESTEEIGPDKDLIDSEQNESPEESPRGSVQRKRPFLENSTACQKST